MCSPLGLLLAIAVLGCNAGKSHPNETADAGYDAASTDADGDGSPVGEDCDDNDPNNFPGNPEVCDGQDNNCDALVDNDAVDAPLWYEDTDGDGYGEDANPQRSCTSIAGYADLGGDCDDSDPAYHPNAPETDCTDPHDYNCDGSVAYADADGDGYAACVDCDDTDASLHPNADETCNGRDDDCDSLVDEDPVDGATVYADKDGDGFGDPAHPTATCAPEPGQVADATDCDDGNPAVHPGATEICNGVDDDCDGTIDPPTSPDAKTWTVDADGDGYGDASTSIVACAAPSGYVADDGDCDDADKAVHPGAPELCNGKDDNCDGLVDDDPTDGHTVYDDADGDGYGDATTARRACDGVTNDADCDDTDPTQPVLVDQTTGSASGDGSSTSPYDTIQAGIDHASGCVVVDPGTYTESISFDGKDLWVTGLSVAGSSPVIDATGIASAAVEFIDGETSAARLKGFTITGGTGWLQPVDESYSCGSGTDPCTDHYDTYCGGGVAVSGSSPTLTDLIIENNLLPPASTTTTSSTDTTTVYSEGGGLCFLDSSSTLTGLTIATNYADQGGGIYLDASSSITISHALVAQNTATDGGGVDVNQGTLTMTNAITAWNTAASQGGGVLANGGMLTEINVAHGGDNALTGGGLDLYGATTATLTNVIVFGVANGYGVVVDSTAVTTFTYDDAYANTPSSYNGIADPTGTNGNISSNPLFTSISSDGDWTDDVWTLTPGSPALDAGDPDPAYDDADGSRNDLGAYGGPGGAGW